MEDFHLKSIHISAESFTDHALTLPIKPHYFLKIFVGKHKARPVLMSINDFGNFWSFLSSSSAEVKVANIHIKCVQCETELQISISERESALPVRLLDFFEYDCV